MTRLLSQYYRQGTHEKTMIQCSYFVREYHSQCQKHPTFTAFQSGSNMRFGTVLQQLKSTPHITSWLYHMVVLLSHVNRLGYKTKGNDKKIMRCGVIIFSSQWNIWIRKSLYCQLQGESAEETRREQKCQRWFPCQKITL